MTSMWHVMQMVYSHDFGVSATLKSGKVLIAGGCEQASGIGQTYNAELYDPQAHTFRGFGILERKRVWASAMELDSGEVVIAGNWYHDDGIDNLLKGAVGQAVQNMNIMFNLDETAGLRLKASAF